MPELSRSATADGRVHAGGGRGCLRPALVAIALTIYVTVRYWYVAVPAVLAIFAIGFGMAMVRTLQRRRLPPSKPGRYDDWLNRLSAKLQELGFTETTRNTGNTLEHVPLLADAVFRAGKERYYVNLFETPKLAANALEGFRGPSDRDRARSEHRLAIMQQGQCVIIANASGKQLDGLRLSALSRALDEMPKA